MSTKEEFDTAKIEAKWRKRWEKEGLYTPDINEAKNPFYNLWMYPYPSAEGLHAGHAFSSTGSDIYGRYMRMNGKDVFQPIGYDSFGIHSENFAIKIGEQPQTMLERTTKHYEEQLKSLGHGYDWTRTVTTSNLDYYKWTQWLFVVMFKAGLAYRAKSQVNWCPSCKTVLADEQVIEGRCERCQTPVERRNLEQWFFRITDYAKKLLNNLKVIDWPQRIKLAQKNWIGESQGAKISFKIKGSKGEIEVFTTRPDTLNGATFLVLSPDSFWVEKLVTKGKQKEVEKYIKESQETSFDEHSREKTGVFTGSYVINPETSREIPVWVADYVVGTYGSGAIMGVPGHDERDMEFAKKFGMDSVKKEPDGKLWEKIEKEGWGVKYINYHLRNWLISRQRYWGPPIPMIFCEHCAKEGKSFFSEAKGKIREDQSDWNHKGWYPVKEEELPVELPFITDYKPKGEATGPLANHPEFYEVACPSCGAKARRETDVSDTFLDSSWYFLRYPSVASKEADKVPFDPEISKKWLPVHLYFGGAEHAVLHLMYSRFVTMVLHDLSLVDFEEPFPRFFAHGLMIKDGAKMSKSRGNVVNPDEYIARFGADTLRLYLMFMGPMDGSPDFRDTGIEGMKRFTDRVWRLVRKCPSISLGGKDKEELLIKLHQTIKKVTEDIQGFRYNTAISAVMELVNLLYEKAEAGESKNRGSEEWKEALRSLTLIIAPFAPHLAEEAWVEILGEKFSVHQALWPQFEAKYLDVSRVEMVVQINGKLRATLLVSPEKGKNEAEILKMAKSEPKVAKWIRGKKVKKSVFVPGKLINLVIG